MTWARNFGDRHGAGTLETGARAKKIQKLCADCGCGLPSNQPTYCKPCFSIRHSRLVQARRKRARQAKKVHATETPGRRDV